jgi:4-alpha-glucanotransferase
VIGEDLGTVPAELPELLAQRNMLSCRVLYFERESDGRFRAAARYSDRALVTSTTHDHPPLASFWQGRDLTLRRQVGQIPHDESLANERARRDRDRQHLIELLIGERLLAGDIRDRPSFEELCIAVHRFLAATPSPLIGVMLDDLAGETEPVNIPGVGADRHEAWSRKMGRTLEAIIEDPLAGRVLELVRGDRATASSA